MGNKPPAEKGPPHTVLRWVRNTEVNLEGGLESKKGYLEREDTPTS